MQHYISDWNLQKNIYGSAVCRGTNEITRLLQSPNFEALFWY